MQLFKIIFFFLFTVSCAMAQDRYPSKFITFIIPWPAGGTADGTMRAIAESMSKDLGVPFVVENKPGASGTLGVTLLAQSKPDGYTIGQIPSSVTRFVHMNRLSFNPMTDLTFLGRTAGLTFGIVVPDSSPFKTLPEYVEFAKKNPGKLTYGSSGAGTNTNIYMEQMAEQFNIKLNHIPFKGGTENMNALLGSHIDSSMDSSVWAPLVLSGKLRLLAVFTDNRLEKFPNVPTLSEYGIKLDGSSPNGIAGPKGLDPKIIAILEKSLEKASKDKLHVEALKKFDMQLMWLGKNDYETYLKDLYQQEEKIVKRFNLK